MTRGLAAIAVCSVAAVAAAADEPAGRPAVDTLVAQLGSASFADREAAARRLEALGAAAVPALTSAVRGPNPEVVRRAAEVLGRLTRGAESAARLRPKTVDLAYRGVPLGSAVNDLKSRTGIPLALDPGGVANPLRLVTCEAGGLPVWEALDVFCRAAGLREVFAAELPVPKAEGNNRRVYYSPPPPPVADAVPVTLVDGIPGPLSGSRSTAVRVLLLPREFPGHRVTLGTGEVTLCFDVCPIPGINWHDVAGVRVTKLIDDAGRCGTGGTLWEPEPNPFDPTGGQVVMNRGGRVVVFRLDGDGSASPPTTQPNPRVVQVPIKVATPAARSLRHLEGVVVAEVVVPGQPLVTVADPARQVGMVFGGPAGARVTVLDVRGDQLVTVRLQLEAPLAAPPSRRRPPFVGGFWPEPPRSADQSPRVRAYDAADHEVAPVSSAYAQTNDDGEAVTTAIQLTYRGGPPARLVVTGPKPTVVEIPFAMENVRLP